MQLQNKTSYFPTSRRLSPNPTHIEMKTALKIKIIHLFQKQTNKKQTGKKKKKKTNLKAHSNKQANKKQKQQQQKQQKKTKEETKTK